MCLVLTLGSQLDWDLGHFDVEQAFIQSELDGEVTMGLPSGCSFMSWTVVRLNEIIYGL